MKTFNKPYEPIRGHVLDCSGSQDMTKQSFKDECDITKILGKFQRTGLLDFVNRAEPQYGEFSGFDLSQSLNAVIKAQEMFDAMPATLRKHFQNDPAQFLEFVDNPNNREKAIELGLISKPLEQGQKAPQAVSDPAPVVGQT